MELYQLNTFVTVASVSSVTRAAQILCTTPPSVSNHIRQLEEKLHIKLFTRTPKGMQITSQGRYLLDQAQAILDSASQLETLAKQLKSDVRGYVAFGINAAPEFLKIPQIIKQVIEAYPGINLEIMPSSTRQTIEDVQQGRMDCGFAFGPVDDIHIQSICLAGVDLLIGIPAKLKKAYQKASIETLTELPWVVPENRCPFFEQVKSHFDQLGVNLNNTVFANDDITKLALVQSGKVVCVLEKSEAQPYIDDQSIVPWKGPETFISRLSFVFSASLADDLLITTMASIVQEIWGHDRPGFLP